MFAALTPTVLVIFLCVGTLLGRISISKRQRVGDEVTAVNGHSVATDRETAISFLRKGGAAIVVFTRAAPSKRMGLFGGSYSCSSSVPRFVFLLLICA